MDGRLATVQALLREIGATRALRAVWEEAPLRDKPRSMDDFAFAGHARPSNLSHGRGEHKHQADFDTTKSLTPDPAQKHQGPTLFDPPKSPFAVFHAARKEAGKAPISHFRDLRAETLSDVADGERKALARVSPLRNVSFDKSDNSCSREISFGEESASSITPEKRPPAAGRRGGASQSISGPLLADGENPFGAGARPPRAADAPRPSAPCSFREEISQLISKAKGGLSLGHSPRPEPAGEDRLVVAYPTSAEQLKPLLGSLRASRPYLFPPAFEGSFVGTLTDEKLLRRVDEETRVLKIELRTFFSATAAPGLVREKYAIERAITTSTFSNVFLCANVHTRKQYVLKRIKPDKTYFDQSLLEVAVLFYLKKKGSSARHRFLEIVECFQYNCALHIITEVLGASLYDEYIKPRRPLSAAELQLVLRDVLTCLKFLKEQGVIHCDIKPENVLLKGSLAQGVRVIDFGSATFANDVDFDYIQTRPYRAPEVVLGCAFDFGVDMWSLGCLAYELVTHKVLFNGKTMPENLAKAMAVSKFYSLEVFAQSARRRPKPFVHGNLVACGAGAELRLLVPRNDYDLAADLRAHACDEQLADLIRGCLVMDPAYRLQVEGALAHPFLRRSFG